MVIITDYNCIDGINKDTKQIHCTPLTPPTPTDKNVIIFQLKPFEQYIYYRNKQLAVMNMYVIIKMYYYTCFVSSTILSISNTIVKYLIFGDVDSRF